ncbi:MAG: hypothetical protein ACTSQZ_04120 [Candidatus Thorarchaeota archaeon]
MADKAANAKTFGALLAQAWEHTPSFICSNDDYIYCLFPVDDTKEKWIEASLTFPDGSLDQKEIDPAKAIALLVEELKVLPTYGTDAIVTSKGKLDQVASRLASLT